MNFLTGANHVEITDDSENGERMFVDVWKDIQDSKLTTYWNASKI
jgi:hypothetical protein